MLKSLIYSCAISVLFASGAAATESPTQKTRGEVCRIVIDTYLTALNGRPYVPTTKDVLHDDLVGLAATVSRHQTLERLMTIAWSQQCDLSSIIEAERERVYTQYRAAQAQ